MFGPLWRSVARKFIDYTKHVFGHARRRLLDGVEDAKVECLKASCRPSAMLRVNNRMVELGKNAWSPALRQLSPPSPQCREGKADPRPPRAAVPPHLTEKVRKAWDAICRQSVQHTILSMCLSDNCASCATSERQRHNMYKRSTSRRGHWNSICMQRLRMILNSHVIPPLFP
jgi:hypothetical protein